MAPDTYRHLDQTDVLAITINMPKLVALVNDMNYGAHRFLSELLRQRRAEEKLAPNSIKIHNDMLEKLINDGFF